MTVTPFEVGACADLGMFDPTLPDCGVGRKLDDAERSIDWLVLMEDRSPDFFHGYRGFDPEANVPLNRHGPNTHAWTQADVKRLVDALRAEGVAVLLGYWVHESRWVDARHPELLIRNAEGETWQDVEVLNADFNPMKRLAADEEAGITEGTPYPDFAIRQWQRLQEDFGFDGLFLGDGAMGFRRHGIDWKDLRHFDFHDDWLAEFEADDAFAPHAECALRRDGASTREKAEDVRAHHWEHWVQWNTDRWTAYYKQMADAVHATGGKLAAYNCMNYDPALARLHGVDYRAIAEAGLDILVHQTYDWAWGPLGPFHADLGVARKDITTNLRSLLALRAHVGYDTNLRIVASVETEDEVEHWNAPVPFTLGELYAYGHAACFDDGGWKRALDGGFIVWANSVPRDEWAFLADAFRTFSRHAPPTPAGARVWREGDEKALVADALKLREPDELYAHLDHELVVGAASAPGVVREADVAKAFPKAPEAVPKARASRSR